MGRTHEDDSRDNRTRSALCCCFLFFLLLGGAAIAVFVVTGFEFGDDSQDAALEGPTPTPTSPFVLTEAPSAAPSLPVTRAPVVPTVRACNGLTSLCDVPVNQVFFATGHNIHHNQPSASFFPNHNVGIDEALEAGIRGLNMDVGFCNGDVDDVPILSMVHSNCLLGSTSAFAQFTRIQRFLGENPNEVVLMPLQIDDGTGGRVDLTVIDDLLQTVRDEQGITMADRLYVHNVNTAANDDEWPTLGDLIDLDQRILLFIYNGEQTCDNTNCPRGFHDWFEWAAETEFSFDSVSALQDDVQRACTITRGGRGRRAFFGVNVFVKIPKVESSAILNQEDFLLAHLEACAAQNSLRPNLVLVDFVGQGDVVDVARKYNEEL